MKLISRFHDYYDGALAQGRDEAVLYVRDRSARALHWPDDHLPWRAPVDTHGQQAGLRRALVGNARKIPKQEKTSRWVLPEHAMEHDPATRAYHEAFVILAGRAYPVWVRDACGTLLLGEGASDEASQGAPSPEPLVSDLQSCFDARRLPGQAPMVAAFHERTRTPDKQRAYHHARERLLAQDFTQLHLDIGAPVLLLDAPRALFPRHPLMETPVQGRLPTAVAVLNPRLADLAFARAVDPFACFQALSQFIAGVVPGQQMPLVEISDRSKVLKHGFDPAYGFRTRPTGMG